MKIKYILMSILLPIGIIGCNSQTKEYSTFLEKYGSDTRTFCRSGFKFRETFLSSKAKEPQLYLIDSQECIQESLNE